MHPSLLRVMVATTGEGKEVAEKYKYFAWMDQREKGSCTLFSIK